MRFEIAMASRRTRGMHCRDKLERLEALIRDMGSLLVAFSGGVDSTFLLKIAKDVLNEGVVALTASSPTYPERELNEAKKLAGRIGTRHLIVESNELQLPGFAQNNVRRCYYCKDELFRLCIAKANELGIAHVADGSNMDDLGDFRPGRDAARELHIRSPLVEVGLTKDEIRILSYDAGLETWDKPSLACLSSRFPYGTAITMKRLERIMICEDTLFELGFKQFRVRHHGNMARIEVEPSELEEFLKEETRKTIIDRFKDAGFTYVALDLQGYRQGSMNEAVEEL